jgi:microcin C transport system substrate-binding protein
MRFKLVLSIFIFTLAAALSGAQAQDQDKNWRHGLSLFGELKYPPGFKRFDYVNPNAPKGGLLRQWARGTFDSFNPFILRGTAAAGSSSIYDTLLARSFDEASSEYGLLAEAVSYPKNFSSVTYRLRANARWHDGKPVTVADVIYSLKVLKAAHPRYRYYYADVIKAEKTGPREVTFRFKTTGNRELPQITGQLPILPKHYWEGVDEDGKKRDFTVTTLVPPLGSGPYRIKSFKTGRSVTLERVEDYWGKDLPVNVGRYNFDRIRIDYYRDNTIALEAFKGDLLDLRFESSAKNWATAYNFKGVRDGKVKRKVFRDKNAAGMQAFVLNTRRKKFADRRVRQAFNLAFDFEWSNKNLFFGQYSRSYSFFANSELAATGLPTGQELEILKPLKGQVPDRVFTTPYKNPVNGDRRNVRANLRKARKLLIQAGWISKDGTLKHDKTGEVMEVEFLLISPLFERIVLPYSRALARLGVKSTVRTIDTSQYRNRLDDFDFDIIVGNWGQSLSPGNEQRNYWGSVSFARKGSRNYIGINDKAIDILIDRIILAKDRAELVAATRALDRVLLAHHFVVPQWYFAGARTAWWDRLGKPDNLPDYSTGFPDIWWFDKAKAAKLKAR